MGTRQLEVVGFEEGFKGHEISHNVGILEGHSRQKRQKGLFGMLDGVKC